MKPAPPHILVLITTASGAKVEQWTPSPIEAGELKREVEARGGTAEVVYWG